MRQHDLLPFISDTTPDSISVPPRANRTPLRDPAIGGAGLRGHRVADLRCGRATGSYSAAVPLGILLLKVAHHVLSAKLVCKGTGDA
jgi:hypothetical protein